MPTHRFGRLMAALTTLILLAACQTTPAPQGADAPLTPNATRSSLLSDVRTYATYYAFNPDQATVDELARRDLAIIQPGALSPTQVRTIQTIGRAVVYLAIGEIGPNNIYYVDGQPVQGQTIIDQHEADGWFVGVNKSYDAPLVNLANPQARAFVVSQADYLLDQHYDGLFLDTVDDAELFATGNPAERFENDFVVLTAGRPDYAAMRRAYIDTIKELRGLGQDAVLIQNGGFDVLLNRENAGDGSEGYVDAVMHEVATTRYWKRFDGPSPSLEPPNYSSWRDYYRVLESQGQAAQAQADRAFREDRDAHAREYRANGGVVLAQDFALPERPDLSCLAYVRAEAEGWIPAFSDAYFAKLYTFPETSAAIRAHEGCADYDYTVAPDFSVTFGPRAAYVPQGESREITLNIGSVQGYDGPVKLRLGKLPPGVTGSLSTSDVTPGPATKATLTLRVGAGVLLGEKIVKVRASSWSETTVYDYRMVVYNPNLQTLWVTNAGNGTVLAFDDLASLPRSSPSRSIGGVQQPYAVAVDAGGNQYVAENVGSPDAAQPAGRILKYAPFATNPTQAISDGLNYPTSLALDAASNLWVANSALDWTGTPRGAPSLRFFAPGAASPTGGFDFPTSYGYPKRIAFDPAGRVWVSTTFGLVVAYENTTGTPQVHTVLSLSSSLNPIRGLAFDAAGNLWLSGSYGGSGRVVRLAAGSWPTGGAFAVAADGLVDVTLSQGVYDPDGLAFDATGNVWVVNQTDATGTGPGSVVKFAGSSLGGSSSPEVTLSLPTRYTIGVAIHRP